MTHLKPYTHLLAYSLIELSLVIAVIAVLSGSALTVLGERSEQSKRASMNDQMDSIAAAIERYYRQHRRVPCVADPTLPESNVSFATEEDCIPDNPVSANIVEVNNGAADQLWMGMVPTHTLGLPNDMAYDAWNQRISYVILQNAARTTVNNSNLSLSVAANGITINDKNNNRINPNNVVNPVLYVLISHGKDKRGAYSKNGIISEACSTQRDGQNCDRNNVIFTDTALTDSSNTATYFYDFIRWRTKYTIDTQLPVATQATPAASDRIKDLDVGVDYACAIHRNNEVWCWGDGTDSKQGTGGGTVNNPDKVLIFGSTVQAQKLALSNRYSCAIAYSTADTRNQAYCWGWNGDRNLGTTSLLDSATPVYADQITGTIIDTATARGTSYYLKNNGLVYGVGHTADNVLATATAIPATQATELLINGIDNVTAIEGGDRAACALKLDKTVWCWGAHNSGYQGSSPAIDDWVPAQVNGLSNIRQIAMNNLHSCAVGEQGEVWCWGANNLGQIGTNTSGADVIIPFRVRDIPPVDYVSVGDNHTCAVTKGWKVYCWGDNATKQLGLASGASSVVPNAVAIDNVRIVKAGRNHSCALKYDASVWCWGSNSLGMLGDNGASGQTATPVMVQEDWPL